MKKNVLANVSQLLSRKQAGVNFDTERNKPLKFMAKLI